MENLLPIMSRKEEIIDSVIKNDITIITSETGSGKSTLVPLFLYEKGFKIIVTQPRRISCTSLANYVSEKTNACVCYHTGFESNLSPNADIIFSTDGLQLCKQISYEKTKNNFVLIVDEIHEWNLNIEAMVAWIKYLAEKGTKLKVVMMSATFDAESLKDFFKDFTTVNTISVKNNKVFSVKDFKCEENDLLDIAVEKSSNNNILIFQAGKNEIEKTINALKNRCDPSITILPLHGELSVKEQKKCFEHYENGKIVVATNVAQTSITIDDIDIVIDDGKEKIISVIDGLETLHYNDISKADIMQRKGRVGRCKDGEYYLCSKKDFSERMEYAIPEIKRLLLDKVVLKLLSVGIDAETIEFFHQPDKNSIKKAKNLLSILGAYDYKTNKITEIGTLMSKIPTNSRNARMLIEASKFNVLDDMIIISAIIEIGSLLYNKIKYENHTFKNHYNRYIDSDLSYKSDILSEKLIYDKYKYDYEEEQGNGINWRNVRKVKEYVNKLNEVLKPILTSNNDIEYDVKNVIKSMLPAMVDNFYLNNWSYLPISKESSEENNKKFVKNSLSECNGKIVMGFPIHINYKDNYGISKEIDMLQFISEISVSDVDKFLPGVFEIIPYDISYFKDENKFIYKIKYLLRDIFVQNSEEIFTVTNNENDKELFETIKTFYYNTNNKDQYIKINNKIYNVEWNEYNNSCSINVTADEVLSFKEAGLTEIKTPFGRPVKLIVDIDYWNRRVGNLEDVYSFVSELTLKKALEQALIDLKKSLPAKTGKLEVILTWIPEIGYRTIKINDYTLNVYIGLCRDKGSFFLKIFISEDIDEAKNIGIECCKFLINELVKRKYNDKNFKILSKEGKKIESKKTETAKNNFHNEVLMAINEVNVENLIDTVEYIDEIYNMYIEEMMS